MGFAPDPAGGAYSVPQTLELYVRGLLLNGGRRRKKEGVGRKRKGGVEGTGRTRFYAPPVANSWLRHWGVARGYGRCRGALLWTSYSLVQASFLYACMKSGNFLGG